MLSVSVETEKTPVVEGTEAEMAQAGQTDTCGRAVRDVRGKSGKRVPDDTANESVLKSTVRDGSAAVSLAHHVLVNVISTVSSDCSPCSILGDKLTKAGVSAVAVWWGGRSVMPDESNKHPMTLGTLPVFSQHRNSAYGGVLGEVVVDVEGSQITCISV